MKPLRYTLIALAASCGFASAQATAYTTPVGYVSQPCLANSDTVVGVPLRISAAAAGALSVAPVVSGTSATLTLSGTPGFTVNAFANTHYAKFKTGLDKGKWYTITANTADSLTVDLNGATTSAVATDQLEVIKFWTLKELFNPAQSTTDPATTGNAIVASTSQLAAGRRTQVLLPNLVGVGTNLAPATTYYIHDSIWKKQGAGATDFGNDQLWPDTYFIIRHPAAVTAPTTYTAVGEVDIWNFNVTLGTQATVRQDNFIALPRPTDIALNALNLAGTPAFVSSTSQLAAGRRDELLVFNNTAVGLNKAPAVTYYHHDGIWKKQGAGATDVGAELIPAGAGFIIRKYQAAGGASSNWDNPGYPALQPTP